MTIQLVHKGKPILFDSDDWSKISCHRWMIDYNGYAMSRRKMIDGISSKEISMHRLILGCDTSQMVDHKNRNRIDNRKNNIRIATPVENSRNKKPYGVSKYSGVSYVAKKYICAAICTGGGKKIYLGTFKTEEEAALAYNEAAKKYFGEFANLNQV